MKTVCVTFGGVSSEYEVSCRSATSVLRNIDKTRWTVVMLGITRDGRWLYYEGSADDIESGAWENSSRARPAVLSPDRSHGGLLVQGIEGARCIAVDVVLPILHGKNGEDGTIQGLCELAGIPCAGAGVLASAVCMDKAVAHILLENAGIPKTKLICLHKEDTKDLPVLEKRLAAELGYPLFVKPANAGSSVGVSKVRSAAFLAEALDAAFAHDRKVVVEKAVVGKEVECAVIGNDTPIASKVLGEIEPTVDFYDYKAKYLDDTAGLYIPARIADDVAQKIRVLAVRAYKALGCTGFCRVDFFACEDGSVVLNELNTIPGFTSISMFPRLFEKSGVSYPELIDKIIEYALSEGEEQTHG